MGRHRQGKNQEIDITPPQKMSEILFFCIADLAKASAWSNVPYQASYIISILNSDNYQQMCQAAHDAVKDYTWECFVDKVLEIIDNR